MMRAQLFQHSKIAEEAVGDAFKLTTIYTYKGDILTLNQIPLFIIDNYIMNRDNNPKMHEQVFIRNA